MAHRDPETGQFVGDDHAGMLAQADDKLVIKRAVEVGDTTGTADYDTENTPVDNYINLELQHDYRILAMEVTLDTWPEKAPNGNDPSTTAAFAPTVVEWVFGTTGTYQGVDAPSNGGSEATGILYRHHTVGQAGQAWGDDTNGNGGYIPGRLQGFTDFVPAEKMVNVDTTPDAGTSLNLHFEVEQDGSSSTSVRHQIEIVIYVQRRDD